MISFVCRYTGQPKIINGATHQPYIVVLCLVQIDSQVSAPNIGMKHVGASGLL